MSSASYVHVHVPCSIEGSAGSPTAAAAPTHPQLVRGHDVEAHNLLVPRKHLQVAWAGCMCISLCVGTQSPRSMKAPARRVRGVHASKHAQRGLSWASAARRHGNRRHTRAHVATASALVPSGLFDPDEWQWAVQLPEAPNPHGHRALAHSPRPDTHLWQQLRLGLEVLRNDLLAHLQDNTAPQNRGLG